MKKLLAFALFSLITVILCAQTNYQDVVYLKNGSIIRGVIIEQVPNQSIKIKTADRNVFVFQIDEVERITKEFRQGRARRSLYGSGFQNGHYKGIIEFGYEIATNYYPLVGNRLRFNAINGYQISPYFYLGLGAGLRYYLRPEAVLMPFFANLRAHFADYYLSPSISLDIGYSISRSTYFRRGGFYLNPTIGINFMISDVSAITLGVGYARQDMSIIGPSGGAFTSDAISIDLGISF